MSRRNIIIGIVVVALVVLGGGAIWYVSSGSGEASTPAHAECDEAIISRSAGATVFRIVPEESEVRFIINEELFGQPKEVTGRTSELAGDVLVNLANPARSEVCAIRINLRTLVTDNEFRNRAIRGQILQSQQDEFEFAQFTPTAVKGLPESAAMGTPVMFQITGDLQVRHITQPVTFDATATLVDEQRMEVSASTTVTRSQYELTIPNAPGVANVGEEVGLEIDFVAVVAPAESDAAE
jgi:polyisoprenoid-binding protein YceI